MIKEFPTSDNRKPSLAFPTFVLLLLIVITVSAVVALVDWTAIADQLIPLLVILFVIGSVFFLLRGKATGDIFAPTSLVPAVYLMAFGLGSSPWFLTVGPIKGIDIELRQWGYYIIGLFAYLMGCWVFSRRNGWAEYPKRLQGWNLDRLLQVVIVLGIVALLVRAILYLRIGIPILHQDVDVKRMEARAIGGLLITLLLLANANVPLLFLYITHTRRHWVFKVFLGIGLLVMIGTLLLSGSRLGIAEAGLFCVLIYHYTRKKLGIRHLVALALILAIFVAVVGFYRMYSKWGELFLLALSTKRGHSSPLFGLVDELVQQVTTGTDGFAFVLDTIPAHVGYRYGWATLTPIRAIVPGSQQNVGDWVKGLYGGTWTGFGKPVTMLGGFYIDAGWIGILIGMFFAGMVIQYLYVKVRRNTSPIWILVYALILSRLLMGARTDIGASTYALVYGPAIFLTTHFYVRRFRRAST